MYTCHAINDIGEAKENFQILTGKQNKNKNGNKTETKAKRVKKTLRKKYSVIRTTGIETIGSYRPKVTLTCRIGRI
jgi:hypothetical protein